MTRGITLLLALLCAAGLAPQALAETDRLVLVTGTRVLAQSDVTFDDTRKIYLGRQIAINGHRITPLVNKSDPLLYQVFLQKVIYMSGSHYERHLLSRVYRRGGKRPPNFTSQHMLIDELQARPFTVTYMWESTARSASNVFVVRSLWTGKGN